MEDESYIIGLQAKIKLLTWLIERECVKTKSRCAEHFRYMEDLRFKYQQELARYERQGNGGD